MTAAKAMALERLSATERRAAAAERSLAATQAEVRDVADALNHTRSDLKAAELAADAAREREREVSSTAAKRVEALEARLAETRALVEKAAEERRALDTALTEEVDGASKAREALSAERAERRSATDEVHRLRATLEESRSAMARDAREANEALQSAQKRIDALEVEKAFALSSSRATREELALERETLKDLRFKLGAADARVAALQARTLAVEARERELLNGRAALEQELAAGAAALHRARQDALESAISAREAATCMGAEKAALKRQLKEMEEESAAACTQAATRLEEVQMECRLLREATQEVEAGRQHVMSERDRLYKQMREYEEMAFYVNSITRTPLAPRPESYFPSPSCASPNNASRASSIAEAVAATAAASAASAAALSKTASYGCKTGAGHAGSPSSSRLSSGRLAATPPYWQSSHEGESPNSIALSRSSPLSAPGNIDVGRGSTRVSCGNAGGTSSNHRAWEDGSISTMRATETPVRAVKLAP